METEKLFLSVDKVNRGLEQINDVLRICESLVHDGAKTTATDLLHDLQRHINDWQEEIAKVYS